MARVVVLLQYKGMAFPELRGYYRFKNLVPVDLYSYLAVIIARNVVLS
jgi:hypothetical protein